MGQFLYPLPDSFYEKNNDTFWHGGTVFLNQEAGQLFYPCQENVSVRSMTNGTVAKTVKDDNSLYQVDILVKDSVYQLPSTGSFVIHYGNVKTETLNEGDEIQQGDVIGQTVGEGLLLNFYIDTDGEQKYESKLTQLQLNGDQVSAYKIWEAILGNDKYRTRCWEVLATSGIKKESDIEAVPSGMIKLQPTVAVPVEYQNTIFSDRFMMDNNYNSVALKSLAYAATHELGEGDEGMSYAKLFRMWILYETVRFPSYGDFRNSQATLDTFARYWSGVAHDLWGGHYTSYGSDPQKSDQWLKDFFNNIKYPDIYGVKKQACIEAMSNGPWQNETTSLGSLDIPSYNKPVVYSVIVPNALYQGGHYVLYRSVNAPLLSANPAVMI